ncbi:numb-like protein isoform X2 [Apostichopus japonicus]|uniref:numb-like protein isoform X2 n=1 Tax=Stichopus japonicus TaxID=307972 RepID=UPI003AB463D6
MSGRFFFGGRKRSSSAPKAMEPPPEMPKRQSTIRRSMRRIRKSFKKKEGYVPPASKPHQYARDEKAVRNSDCQFYVKYLGAVEVSESRGMSVCEEAAKRLRANPQHKVRALLQVSGDALRVVAEEGQGLLVDQTIEKVSFCAPDRNDDRGFAYISRDGTTRRWLCHCFLALKEPGERLSHAVGCAFAACLERKQQRDKLCGVKVEFDVNKTSFTRQGSFKQTTMTEQLEEEAQKENNELTISDDKASPPKPVVNPYALPRRHATEAMLERQGSFRGFSVLNNNTPFKRNLSLRLNELPSTLQRQNQVLETVPDMSPTSPTGGASHGLGVLTEQPEQVAAAGPQSNVYAQVHAGTPLYSTGQPVPMVNHQQFTTPPGYGTPPPVPQTAMGPTPPFQQGPTQPATVGMGMPYVGAVQHPAQSDNTNPWGEPQQNYNPWGNASPPAPGPLQKSEAEKWLEDTSRNVAQRSPPQVNGGGMSASVSVNHNNANNSHQKSPSQNGTGINGSWVTDISQSLQAAEEHNGHVVKNPEFESKWGQSPVNKASSQESPFGDAVQTFEVNL